VSGWYSCAEGTIDISPELGRSPTLGGGKWTNESMNEWINDVSVNPNGADFVRRVGLVWVVPLAHWLCLQHKIRGGGFQPPSLLLWSEDPIPLRILG